MQLFKTIAASLTLSLLVACGGGGDDDSAAAGAVSKAAMVVAFGDSLTEGGAYVTPGSDWVSKLQAQVKADGLDATAPVTVVNEGRSGETTTQALARLPGVLSAYKPTHIFLAHATNDIWWECPGCYDRAQGNLLQMANLAKAAGAQVIMTDITFKIRGEADAQAYTAMFTNVASATGSSYANLVNGIPLDGTNYHPDLVHLRDAAQEALKNNAKGALYPLLN